MFDDNKYREQDEMFRAILEDGQEPVPAHVWEGIEADLDRIARRRMAAVWFRRATVGMAAAAAVAVGMFYSLNGNEDIVSPSENGDMIAVVEPEQTEKTGQEILMADVENAARQVTVLEGSFISETPDISEATGNTEYAADDSHDGDGSAAAEPAGTSDKEESQQTAVQETSDSSAGTGSSAEKEEQLRFPDVWPEDEKEKSGKAVRSLTLSGLTGTNGTQNSFRVNPMRSPALSSAPRKTGIKETSTNTTYGIPVSFGAGIRFNISKRWSLGTGLNYTLLTRKFYGTYIPEDPKEADISSDIRESQHFIGLPVNFYYDIVNQKNINFYTYFGGAAEKCISDKFQVMDTAITHTEKVKGLQWSANLGLGVEFMLGRHLGIYVDPSLRYYFNNNQPKSIRTAQPLMFGLEMGLRVNL